MANQLLRQMESVSSRDDLSGFVVALLEDHEKNPYQWNNSSLYPFLDAMASCIQQKDERYENYNKPFSEDQPWKSFAEILYVAKIYGEYERLLCAISGHSYTHKKPGTRPG